MSYASDPATVAGTFPAAELACGPFSFDGATVGQTYRPQDFGFSGPHRVSGISIGWSGAANWTLTGRDALGSVVMGPCQFDLGQRYNPRRNYCTFLRRR